MAVSVGEFLKEAAARTALLVAVLVVISALALWALRWLRDSIGKDSSTNSELGSTYRELYERGDISEEEYRTIQNRLRARSRKSPANADRQ